MGEQTQANDTYTLFAVKHVAEVFVGFRVFADESENPFIRFVVCTEGDPVELTVVQHVLGKKQQRPRRSLFTHFMSLANRIPALAAGTARRSASKHLPNNITHFCLGIQYLHSINGDLELHFWGLQSLRLLDVSLKLSITRKKFFGLSAALENRNQEKCKRPDNECETMWEATDHEPEPWMKCRNPTAATETE